MVSASATYIRSTPGSVAAAESLNRAQGLALKTQQGGGDPFEPIAPPRSAIIVGSSVIGGVVSAFFDPSRSPVGALVGAVVGGLLVEQGKLDRMAGEFKRLGGEIKTLRKEFVNFQGHAVASAGVSGERRIVHRSHSVALNSRFAFAITALGLIAVGASIETGLPLTWQPYSLGTGIGLVALGAIAGIEAKYSQYGVRRDNLIDAEVILR